MSLELQVVKLGVRDYLTVWQAMTAFTQQRDQNTPDQLWLVQHPAVFTQGQAGKPEHLLFPGDIPVVQSDRGGQVTYHGPGQLVAYPLVDLRRLKIGVRDLVTAIEQIIVDTVAEFGIEAYPRADAPGVYVNGDKVASLGLRVRRGCSFHGLGLNVTTDLEPFKRINPCGYQGLAMCKMADLAPEPFTYGQVEDALIQQFVKKFAYEHCTMLPQTAA